MTKRTILVVEDEEDIRELLVYNLEREGYTAIGCGDGKKGLALARARLPDLILLDLMLPGLDGLSVCRELARERETACIPLVMLTAKGEEMDRIVGLELGADDYVVKPFSVRELILRVRNVLKRREPAGPDAILERHAIVIDAAAHKVTAAGNVVDLTATEFRLLENLMRHAGQVRTREQLLEGVWGYHFEGYARTVDTHMRRLRAKLGDAAAKALETVRGVGYRFRE